MNQGGGGKLYVTADRVATPLASAVLPGEKKKKTPVVNVKNMLEN